MRVSEEFVSVPLIEAKDYGSVGIDGDGVNLGKLISLSMLFVFGALTGNSTLKLYAGATAAKTTAVAFSYRLGAAVFKAANADQFGDPIAVLSTGLVLTAAAFQHRQLAIEVDADTLLEGKSWLTIEIDSVATVLNVGAVGVGRPRQAGHLPASVL